MFRGNGELRSRLDTSPNAEGWLERDSGGYFNLDAAGYQQMLAFHRPGSFPLWSLDQLLNRQVPQAQIRGRIVLIGSTAPSLRDLFNVPYTRFVLTARQMQMPGVELHANRTAALLALADGRPLGLRALPGWSGMLLLVLGLGLGVALGESFATLRRSILAVTAVLLLGLGGAVALLLNGVWLQTTLPLAGLTLMAGAAWLRRGAASQQQRQQIQRLLGQTTSPAVAQQLWEQRDELLSDGRFEGRLLAVTVIFSDTCDFTTLSERLKPADLLAWLNRGMALCVPAITERGGMVNKFTGDGFLAVFGAPLGKGRWPTRAKRSTPPWRSSTAWSNSTATWPPTASRRCACASGFIPALCWRARWEAASGWNTRSSVTRSTAPHGWKAPRKRVRTASAGCWFPR